MRSLIVLAQCPCSGGGSGGSNPVTGLLILAGFAMLWWLSRLVWRRWLCKGVLEMFRYPKSTVIVILLAINVAVIYYTYFRSPRSLSGRPARTAAVLPITDRNPSGLPRLLDLGATQCIPCKMMAPILEELKAEYAGRMQVDFIDVWKDTAAGQRYGIDGIPTQIFFDSSGKELYRHQGFMPKQDILAKCGELGFDLSAAGPSTRP